VDVVIVAGEMSGDQLGAHLVNEVRAAHPQVRFHGIAGPKMHAAGVNAWFDSQALAVRGYAEVLTALPRILRIKNSLIEKTLALKPKAYIGVDAPDFNLRIERVLKSKGVFTMHYVCPSFWAWRPERAATFEQSVNHMLCLFPFEPDLLAKHKLPASFVGHPLATAPLVNAEQEPLRRKLDHYLDAPSKPIIAILPGSRDSELKYHADVFVQTMKLIAADYTEARFAVPLPTRSTRLAFARALWAHAPELAPQVNLMFGHADFALRVADVALVASGTATLEAAMLDCPQIVSYRISDTTYAIVKRKIKTPYVSLPNLLSKSWVVPELLQAKATPALLSDALKQLLAHNELREAQLTAYATIRKSLTAAPGTVGRAVAGLLNLSRRA
jgi:lipid-A-disaccharide synthase